MMSSAFALVLVLALHPQVATSPKAVTPAAPTAPTPVALDPNAAPAKPARIALGATAPGGSRELSGVDGKSVKLDDISTAKGLLVVFTCNHCPYVKSWQDRMVDLGNAAVKKGIGVVFVNSNDPQIVPGDDMKGMKELATAKKYGFPYVADAGAVMAVAFGATRTPEVFLFDADGKLAYHGTIDDNSQDAKAVKTRFLADAIGAVAAGKAVTTQETKAIGCSIKFPKA